MTVTSLKTDGEIYDLKIFPLWIQKGITLEHFIYLFQETNFLRWLLNSFMVSGATTVISVVFSTLAAYSLTRLQFPGSNTMAVAIFISYLVPPTLLFIPLSSVVSHLGLTDSVGSLMLTYPTFIIPFCTWMLMSYFKTIPVSLEECALIDGASRWQVIYSIVLPIALPGITTAALFAFSLSWAQFIYPIAFVSSSPNQVISVGVATELIRGDVYFWGSLMGGALLASIPIIILYSFFTKYFISGLTGGAMKY